MSGTLPYYLKGFSMAGNEVVLWTGAGQIGMAIARRVGYGKKILVGDKSIVVNCYVPLENMNPYAMVSASAMSYAIIGY